MNKTAIIATVIGVSLIAGAIIGLLILASDVSGQEVRSARARFQTGPTEIKDKGNWVEIYQPGFRYLWINKQHFVAAAVYKETIERGDPYALYLKVGGDSWRFDIESLDEGIGTMNEIIKLHNEGKQE